MMRWIALFATFSFGMVGATLSMLWALNSFHGLGMQGHLLIALLLGVFFTTLLGAGLMTLMFWSNRHHRDERAYHWDSEPSGSPDRATLSDDEG